jgi:hypothetical protein
MLQARKSVVSSDLRPRSGGDGSEFGYLDEKTNASKYSIKRNHKYEFNIRSKNVLDDILAVFSVNFKDDPHFKDIYAHFDAFDSKVLDQYSDFIVVIPIYGSRIRFISSRMEYSGMEYTLNEWGSIPAKQFRKRPKFLGIF